MSTPPPEPADPFGSTPGIRVVPIKTKVAVRVHRTPLDLPADAQSAIDDAWDALCRSNPRYFDGTILSYESYDHTNTTISARAVPYRVHAARSVYDAGVRFLGITGIIRVGPSYLLARRGDAVHDYPGQWEFAPCGGIDPPPGDTHTIAPPAVRSEITREAREELGIDLFDAPCPAAWLVHDDPAGSTDLMMLLDLPSRPATQTNWEVSGVRWATLDEILEHTAEPTIPTTLAVARWLSGER